ncbi:MAG TPA: efflux RND transporter permease subunit, partial [Myxococcota bacterium]|nr:efflux RND transporter permease subunit [Myxococcota bacterium]
MRLTEVCIRKPVFAWMLMAATLVFGGVALQRIGISQFPDVDFPMISVYVDWEGAAPEVIEHDALEIIEEGLVQVEGIRSISSSAHQGSAWIGVELDLSRNVDVALQDVQTRLAQVASRLPRDMDPPVVWKSNPEDQPIMWIGLSGPFAPQMLADVARYQVRERLQTVPGVGEITMGGYLERNIRIWVDGVRLNERALTVEDVIAALRREHVELPAGRLEGQSREVNVRVMGEAFDLRTLRRIVVRSEGGAPIYLEDVALVEDGFEDVRRMARMDGAPSQGLGVRKQRGANAVAVAAEVRAALAAIRDNLPDGMRLQVNFDSTQFIGESVHEIELEIGLAVVLTALVCWIFLGSLSSTFNVVLAIPMSLFGTVAVLYFLGYTLNTFTLLALGLAVGIVVDDAIMVLENIFRHGEMGKDRVDAAREGTAEITFAALAATLAVVAIFVPVVFMGGVIGRFFLQFGVALSVAVILSYVEAITLAPARCAQFLNVARERQSRVGQWMDHAFERLSARYRALLGRTLARPGWILVGALVLCCASAGAFTLLPREFVPSQDQSRLLLRLSTATGSGLEDTDALVQRAETFIRARPEVQRLFSVVGSSSGAVNAGFMFMTLVPPGQRDLSQTAFANVLRRELNGYAGLKVIVQDMSQSGFTAQRGFPVEFSLRGPDWEQLVRLSQDLQHKLETGGFVADLDSDYEIGMPELRITPGRARAADVGVSMESVAST